MKSTDFYHEMYRGNKKRKFIKNSLMRFLKLMSTGFSSIAEQGKQNLNAWVLLKVHNT